MTKSADIGLRLVAGIGCTSSAASDEVIDLIRQALAEVPGELVALATVPRRANHPALRSAAADLGVPLRVVDLPGPEVAEPVAASAGPLVLGKLKSNRVTCALAVVPADFEPLLWGQPSSSAAMAASTEATSMAGP